LTLAAARADTQPRVAVLLDHGTPHWRWRGRGVVWWRAM